MEPHQLTWVAEHCGLLGGDAAEQPLLGYLAHESPLVREGAVYGASCHLDRPALRSALERMAVDDPSPGVRDAAREALEDG